MTSQYAPKGAFDVKRIAIVILLVSAVMFEGFFVPSAHANAGPPIKVEDGDTTFFVPVKHESIAIVSEDLTYDIKALDEKVAYAEIRATYQMRNTSQEPVSALVAFVANNPDTPVQVTLDGHPVSVTKSAAMPWNVTGKQHYVGDLLKRQWSNVGSWTEYGAWEPTFEEVLQFAGTGERAGDTNSGYDLELSMFEVTLDAEASHTLSVSYTEDAAVIYEGKGYKYVNPKAEFYYFLEPAQYWKDFSDLTVTVRVPEKLKFEASLDGFAREEGAYVARFAKLPERNLRILVSLSSPSLLQSLPKPVVWAACLLYLVARAIRRKAQVATGK